MLLKNHPCAGREFYAHTSHDGRTLRQRYRTEYRRSKIGRRVHFLSSHVIVHKKTNDILGMLFSSPSKSELSTTAAIAATVVTTIAPFTMA
jgi:hypothetical protein